MLSHRGHGLRRYWNFSHTQGEPDPKLRDFFFQRTPYNKRVSLATLPSAKSTSMLCSVPFHPALLEFALGMLRVIVLKALTSFYSYLQAHASQSVVFNLPELG